MTKKLLPLLLLLLASCGVPEGEVRIEGEFKGLNQADIYIYDEDETFDGIDTIRIENGKFEYGCPLDEKKILTLLFPNFSEMYVIAEPGKAITIEGDAAKLLETAITGTEENELMSEFRRHNIDTKEQHLQMAVSDFIHSHPAHMASVALFRKHFAKAHKPDAQTALSLLDVMKKAQPENTGLFRLDNRLRPLLTTAEGKKLPDFEARLLDDRKVSGKDYAGKPLLICFSASWQSDFHHTCNTLKSLRRTYGERLQLLNVSLDLNRHTLLRQLRRDTLETLTVCEELGFESPLALRFGVRYVPGYLLVDSTGTVVARETSSDNVKKKLGKLLKK